MNAVPSPERLDVCGADAEERLGFARFGKIAQWHGLPVDWLSDLQIQPPFQSQMIVDFEFSIELKSGRSVRWQSVSEQLPKHTPPYT